MPLLPVEPDVAEGLATAEPVPPEPPVLPDAAVPLAVGLDVASPVFPPVELDVAIVLPVFPEVALPVEDAVVFPEFPPVAVPVALPELPVMEVADTAPEPPPRITQPELPASAFALPVSPDSGLVVAFPPSPLIAMFSGVLIALPESPESPPITTDLLVESPEEAFPSADGDEVALPDSPVLPEFPDTAVPTFWPLSTGQVLHSVTVLEL